MSINHNRIKVSDLEKDLPNKILTTNASGELEFNEIYNALDCAVEGQVLDARQGKELKDLIDNISSLLVSDNLNLDTIQELAEAVETIQTSISTILVNDLTTGGITQALTAEMGKTLKGFIDNLAILVNNHLLDNEAHQDLFDAKVDKELGKSLLSDTEISRLATLSNYIHPLNHPASIIVQDSENRFVTDAEKAAWDNKQSALNGTGFVKTNGTTISYDNSIYLTNIGGITAGGELSGTYPNPTLSNNAVIGKTLTGLNITGSTITASDSILAAFGKLQNQVNSLIGSSIYQGVWNASTNSPSLTSGVGTKGNYYKVSVAGSTNIDGITDWNIGDWVIFNGTTWDKVDNTDSVSSVNGYTGSVNLTTSNVPEGTGLYYTEARVSANSSVAANTVARHVAVTLGTTNGLSLSGQQLSLGLASTSTTGTLSSTDWNNFNNKQSSLSGTGIVKSTNGTISYLIDNSSNWNTAYSWGNHAGLYPSLTGSGASGTWNIDVLGSSKLLSPVGNYTFNTSTNGRDFALGLQLGFVDGGGGYPNYGTVLRGKSYNASQDGSTFEMYYPYSAGYGGNSIKYRIGLYDNGGMTPWRDLLDSNNYNSYSPTLTGGGASGSWNIHSNSSAKLYSSDSIYSYGSGNPYYGYLTYNGAANRWRFKVYPGTPEDVEVSYADNAGTSNNSNALNGYSYGSFVGKFGYTIDASGLDAYTYYPVTIGLGANTQTKISVIVALDSGTTPPWSTHAGGFSVTYSSTVNGGGWGTMPITRIIHTYVSGFSNVEPIGGVTQMYNSSTEVIYVRGGGRYYFYTSEPRNVVLRTSTYTIYDQSVSPSTSVVNNPLYQSAGSASSFGNLLVGSSQVLHSGNYSGYSNFSGGVIGESLSVNNTNGAGYGLSLYGSYTGVNPSYGMMFAGTGNYGTHGFVTSDWATYLTMTGSDSRGWVFRHNNFNRASIDGLGNAKFNGEVVSDGLLTSTASSYGRIHLGTVSSSWGGALYPTLFSNQADRWVMHINPHISYVQNGANGYTGSMTGATIRFASHTSADYPWDLGIGTNGMGTDKFSIGRNSVNFFSISNNGGASFPYWVDVINSIYAYGGISVGSAGSRTGNLANVNSIAIGDSDTGFRQNGDGILETFANGVLVKTETSSGILSSLSITAPNFIGNATAAFGMGTYSSVGSLTGAGFKQNSHWDSRPGGNDAFVIGHHTGVTIHGYGGYGGVRLYSAGYPDLTSSVLRLEASDSVKTYGNLHNDSTIYGNNISLSGTIYSSNWFRSYGSSGWFNETFGGGIHMTDSTFVTVYNSKKFYVNNDIHIQAGSGYALWGTGSDATTFGHRMASVGTSGAGRISGETTSDYNIYFHMAGGLNRGFVFKNDSTFLMSINGDGVRTTTSVTATAFYQSSDIRLKMLIDSKYGDVSSIEAISYKWKDESDDKTHIGYSAQEVQEVLPDAVNEDGDGMLSVDYIQVLVAKMAKMEAEIKELKSKLN